MADTIESFVEKLQQEGVAAGRTEAEKLIADARSQAEKIIADAQGQAEKILADAQTQAEQTVQRGREELQLAARDVMGRLRQAVASAVGAVLAKGAADALRDKDFLAGLIRDVVGQFAAQDAKGVWPIEVSVSDEMLKDLSQRALAAAAGQAEDGSRVSLAGQLKGAGFEYDAAGGTVEVTAESIAAVLGEMIAPRLREMIDAPAGGQDK